jgi:molybdopterin synthase catalytic subunit
VAVRVRLFAGLRERAGWSERELDGTATVGDVWAALGLGEEPPGLLYAVNKEYAEQDQRLADGDEVAVIPPVSGGAFRLSSEPLSLDAVVDEVRDHRAGAIATFVGTTRVESRGRTVLHLDYEAYAEMAAEQIEAIVAAAIERHGLCAAAAEHRVGRVPRSEASVIVAASAPHRAEAFAGAREIIDEIKRRAPIWKREEGDWVAGQTPPTGS